MKAPRRWYIDVVRRPAGTFQGVAQFYGGIKRTTLPTRTLRCRHAHATFEDAKECALDRAVRAETQR